MTTDKKRLIDANALRTQFDDIPPFIGMTGGCVQQCIDKAPTVDAVEVVRCKDCERTEESMHSGCVWCIEHSKTMLENDFCSYGERKNNGSA